MNKKKYFSQRKFVVLLAFFITAWSNAQQKTTFEFTETVDVALRRTMQNNANALFEDIHDAYFSGKAGLSISQNHATPEAIEQIQALWSTSQFYCKMPDVKKRVLKSANGFQVRNIPVFFKQGENEEEQNQDIAIEFTSQGRISDFFIAIPMHQYQQILETRDTVTDLRRRQLVVGFVDNFRTAYNRKDIAYLKQVFSEDALIIVGNGKKLERSGDGLPNYEYVVHDKASYITKLQGVFNNNKYINVKFSDIEVLQPYKNKGVYCVTLRQEWNSSNYSDVGWLFLMIDIRDDNKPLIWVRAWDHENVSKDDRISAGDFNPQFK